MTEVTRYALWLLPGEEASAAFADLIEQLSQRYHGPRFAPHITLLGWVTGPEETLVQTTAELAEQLDPFILRSTRVDGEPNYFRCCYLRLEKSASLLEAQEKASATFSARHSSDYQPHLSLIYGQLSTAEKRSLQRELADTQPAAFTVDRLQLVHVTESVADWRPISTRPVGETA